MGTLLVKNIHTLVTMNGAREELRDAAIFVRDHVIEQVGPTASLPKSAHEVLDLRGRHVVLPGLVNTHHHFYQTLTRAVPVAQNCDLFNWLKALYPIWARMTPEGVRASAQMCAAELILSGCTTASDHLYVFPHGSTLDDEIHAIETSGLRFHASRGSMSVGEISVGCRRIRWWNGKSHILRDSQRVIETFHNPARHSMLRITLAPCSPFSVSQDLMRETAALARSYEGVRLHTHLAENKSDVDYSLATFGLAAWRLRGVGGLAGPGRVARTLRLPERRRHREVRPYRYRRRALPLQQPATRQRARPDAPYAQRRCSRWTGRGWRGIERCHQSVSRSAPGVPGRASAGFGRCGNDRARGA